MNCKYMCQSLLEWMLNNKVIVFLSLLSFCLFVSTLALAGQRNRLSVRLSECEAESETTTAATDNPALPSVSASDANSSPTAAATTAATDNPTSPNESTSDATSSPPDSATTATTEDPTSPNESTSDATSSPTDSATTVENTSPDGEQSPAGPEQPKSWTDKMVVRPEEGSEDETRASDSVRSALQDYGLLTKMISS